MKKPLALKKIGRPDDDNDGDRETDGRAEAREKAIAKKVTDAAKPFGGLRPGGVTRDATLKPKPALPAQASPTAAKARAVGGAASSSIGTMVERFIGKKKPLVLAKKSDPLPKPDISKLAPAAKTIAARTDTKLKRMSQQITRGTRAANPNPFKKKSP
jgi:hypothetical protein